MSKDINDVCNPKTFKKLYFLFAKEVKSFLIFKYGNIEQAEDVTQDSFIKLWENCKNVPLKKVKNYLFTISSNAFINIKIHEQVVRKHQKNIKIGVTNESPEFTLLEKEFYVKLKQTIESLPEKQKEVFLMSRIEKLKYKEIAQRLDISVKAVEKRMSLALKIMRDKIGNI
jgi:RNA polymerase sigma-70 factor (ECF subfamily)